MNYHKKYSKKISITDSLEAYILTIVHKKTLEGISYKYCREEELKDEALGGIQSLPTISELVEESQY